MRGICMGSVCMFGVCVECLVVCSCVCVRLVYGSVKCVLVFVCWYVFVSVVCMCVAMCLCVWCEWCVCVCVRSVYIFCV